MTPYGGKNASIEGNGTLPAFATFSQLQSLGYMVKKGAKGVKIFCGYREKKEAKGKTARVPKFATVFDIIDTTANDDKEFLKYLATETKKLITGVENANSN